MKKLFVSNPKWHLRHLVPPCLLAVIALGAWLLLARDGAANAPPASSPPAALTVEAVRVSTASWPQQVQARGVIAAWDEISIVAEVAQAKVQTLHADVGDSVQAGQLLAQLDNAELLAQLTALQAQHTRAEGLWRQAQSNWERHQALDADAAPSQRELEALETNARIARAEADAAAAQLALQRLQLRRAEVRSPHPGVVSARNTTTGAIPAVGQELFRVLRDRRLEWRAELSTDQLGRIGAGQRATVHLPDGGVATGRVRQVSPVVDARSRLGTAYVDLDTGSQARAGMYAGGTLDIGRAEARVLPASAVLVRDGQTLVARLLSEAQTRRVSLVTVTLGRRQGPWVEILEPLQPGDEVVRAGAGLLGEGDAVRVLPSGNALPALVRQGGEK